MNPVGGTTPGRAEVRFPGFDVTAQSRHWDGVTARVVLGRLAAPQGAPVFFTPSEAPVARALLDRLLAQDEEPRVPVFEAVDRRLAEGRGDGYRYADMPPDPEAWRRSLAGLDADAADAGDGGPGGGGAGGRGAGAVGFASLPPVVQRDLIEAVRSSSGRWHGLPGGRVFSLWLRYAATAFYAHPWAWNEIGFSGPAYPRGYKAMAPGALEPFEVHERDARDPVPWARRVEEAHRRHGSPGGAG